VSPPLLSTHHNYTKTTLSSRPCINEATRENQPKLPSNAAVVVYVAGQACIPLHYSTLVNSSTPHLITLISNYTHISQKKNSVKQTITTKKVALILVLA